MSETIYNEAFELLYDQATTNSPDIKMPETCENSSAIFTDQNIGNTDDWFDHGQKTLREEYKRNQEVIDQCRLPLTIGICSYI
jgi:hypothetical protein